MHAVIEFVDQYTWIPAMLMSFAYMLVPTIDASLGNDLHKTVVGDYSSRLGKMARKNRIRDFMFWNIPLWLLVGLIWFLQSSYISVSLRKDMLEFRGYLLIGLVWFLGSMYMSLVDDWRSLVANKKLLDSDDYLPNLKPLTDVVEQEIHHKESQIKDRATQEIGRDL